METLKSITDKRVGAGPRFTEEVDRRYESYLALKDLRGEEYAVQTLIIDAMMLCFHRQIGEPRTSEVIQGE